nr:unnamed protein product [Digitaria exilis]
MLVVATVLTGERMSSSHAGAASSTRPPPIHHRRQLLPQAGLTSRLRLLLPGISKCPCWPMDDGRQQTTTIPAIRVPRGYPIPLFAVAVISTALSYPPSSAREDR